MNRRGCLWFAGGLLLALGAAIAVFVTLQGATQQAAAPALPAPGVQVLVAARDIPLHTVIAAADAMVRELPPEAVPADSLKDPADAIGKLTTAAIAKDEAVLARRLIVPDYVGPQAAFVMDPKQLLVAFPASDRLSGLEVVRPGDKVDVVLTYDFGKSASRVESSTNTFIALHCVRLAAVMRGPAGEGGQPGPVRAYLLALDPQDMLTIKHFADMGAAIDLALRSPAAADTPFEVVPVDGDYLLERYRVRTRAKTSP